MNWPGAADVMIPEGLQYASIKSIVSGIKSLGMNVIRLTFAIEMIDDILDDGGDVTVQTALTSALGVENGCTLYKEIVKNNPSFSSATTRLQVGARENVLWSYIAYINLHRSMMRLQPSVSNNKSTFTWTIICLTAIGAVPRQMATPGSETHILMLQSGNGGWNIW